MVNLKPRLRFQLHVQIYLENESTPLEEVLELEFLDLN